MSNQSEIIDLSAEIDRMIAAEQIEIWRSDPLQILDKIGDLTGLKWKDGLVGKWNGLRIVGFVIAFRVSFSFWYWTPKVSKWAEWQLWLCFGLSVQWRYSLK